MFEYLVRPPGPNHGTAAGDAAAGAGADATAIRAWTRALIQGAGVIPLPDSFGASGRSQSPVHAPYPQPGPVDEPASQLPVPGTCDDTDEAGIDRERELIDRLRVLEELKNAAAAAQARAAAAFNESSRRRQARAGVPRDQLGRGVAAQIALARRESPHRGGRLLGFAMALTAEMPCTLLALTLGKISEWRATLLVRETACLSVEDRRTVDREVAGDLATVESLGDRQIVARARAVAYRLDPQAAANRAAKAADERYVSCRPAPDTMTYLTGLLPVAQGVGVYAALSREADRLRAAGDSRGRGQIMADTLVERITGQARADRMNVEVQLVMTDRSLLGGDSEPAYVPGYGPVPAQWARDLVRAGSGSDTGADTDIDRRKPAPTGTGTRRSGGTDRGWSAPAPTGRGRGGPGTAESGGPESGGPEPDQAMQRWIRRLYTAPDSGELVAMDSRARLFPAALARFIAARDQTCRMPWCGAPIRHIDHVRSYARDGATEAANGQGLCEACNHAKEAPGWRSEPGGHSGSVPGGLRQRPPDGNREELPDGRREEPPDGNREEPPDGHGERTPGSRESDAAFGHVVETATPTGHRYRSFCPPMPGSRAQAPAGSPLESGIIDLLWAA